MTNPKESSGVIVPVVSPFTEYGQIDLEATKRITRHLLKHECMPFLMGTTGESASIPNNQRNGFVASVVEEVDGKLPVYVSISSNCFEESVQMASDFLSIGASVTVVHLPYYYRLKSHQMKEYFLRLADAIKGPLILYNIPATTQMSIPLEVIFELSQHPNILGIKDSERDVKRHETIIEFCKEKKGFSHLCGWAAQSVYTLSIGSDGLVPSAGNFIPGLYRQLYVAVSNDEHEAAKNLQDETDTISVIYQKGLGLSESITALKVIMNDLGLCEKKVLPPFSPLSPKKEEWIVTKMTELSVRQKANLI